MPTVATKMGESLEEPGDFYGGKLKDLSFVSTHTLTTFVFWLFSGSLLAVGMGEKGLMATRTSTLVVEPFGDLALRML